jgi:hypothetical protein
MADKPKVPENLRAESMTYEVRLQPSMAAQRNRLLAGAADMSMDDLKAAAAEAQVPAEGRSRAEVLTSIQTAIAPTTAEG